MQIDSQDVEGLNQRGTGRLQFKGLVCISRKFPGLDLIGELVDTVSEGHDFADRPSVIPHIPGVCD